MKIPARNAAVGMTMIDVLIVIAVVALLGVCLCLPRPGCRVSARRIACVNNLKQTGIALRVWASDHENCLPWTVPQSEGGTLEIQRTLGVFRHFQIASQQLNTPKVLHCPEDAQRSRATNFGPKLSNQNISYFVGLDTDLTRPQTILSGDRTLTVTSNIMSGLVEITNPNLASWASGLHKSGGNLLLRDGSAQQCSGLSLRRQLLSGKQSSGAASSRFSIP